MSKGHHKNGLFVDTRFLRDHVSKLYEEKKMAAKLYETVVAMKQHSDPADVQRYDSILQDVDALLEYFGRMARLFAEIDDDVVQLENSLGRMIEDDTNRVRHTVSSTFML